MPRIPVPKKDDSDIISQEGLMHFLKANDLIIISNNKNMFNISFENIKSALVSAFITGVLGMGGYIIGLGDIYKVDFHSLINIGAISAITAIVSLLKAFLTSEKGVFVGAVKINPTVD